MDLVAGINTVVSMAHLAEEELDLVEQTRQHQVGCPGQQLVVFVLAGVVGNEDDFPGAVLWVRVVTFRAMDNSLEHRDEVVRIACPPVLRHVDVLVAVSADVVC